MEQELTQQPSPSDNVSKIYSYLKQNNVRVPDNEESFRSSLSDKKNSDKIHSYLKENNIKTLDSPDDFYSSINLVKKKDNEAQKESVSSSGSEGPGQPSGKNTKSIQLNENQKKVLAENTKPKTQQEVDFEQGQKAESLRDAKEMATGKKQSNELFKIPVVEDLAKTIHSGLSDQLPKEYYAQRLRMSKGEFGDLYDSRSDLNQFGGDKFAKELPSIDAFKEWSLKQPSAIQSKTLNERSKIFLVEKLGEKGFADLKSKFITSNINQRIGYEKNIEEQNLEAGSKLEGVVQDLRDVHGAVDFLNFTGNMVGQALYRAPTSIIGGPIGSIIAESSAVYDRQIDLIAQDKGISREEVIRQGLDKPAEGQTLAVLAGTLDAASEFNLVGMFKKAVGKGLTESMVKKFAKGFVRGGVPESLTEAAQGEIEEFAASQGAGVEYKPDGWRIATGAVGGLIGGGLLGGGSNVNASPENRINAPKGVLGLTPEQQAQPTVELVKTQTENLSSSDTPSIEKAADVIDEKVQQADEATVANEAPLVEATSEELKTTDVLPTTTNLEENVQVSQAEGLLQREQGGDEIQGSERGGVEPVQQGESVAGESTTKEETVRQDQAQEEIKTDEGTQQQEQITPEIVHVAAKESGIDFESKEFIDKSEELTGKERLDDMSPVELNKMIDFIKAKNTVNKKLDALVESGDIKREGNKITIVTEKGGEESKSAYDEFKNEQERIKTNNTEDEQPIQKESNGIQGNIINQQTTPGPSVAGEVTTPLVKERKFSNQILNDKNISDEVKQGLSEDAKTYIPKAMSITDSEAKAIIEVKGSDGAMDDYLDKSNDMSSDVRVTLGENLIRKFNQDKDFENAIKVSDNLAKYFTDLGRAVNAAKIFQMLSPEGVLKYISKEITKAKVEYSKKTSEKRKKLKQEIDTINKVAVEKILSDPNIRKKVISESKKGNIKKAIDFLETLKVDVKGKTLDATYGLTAVAWNTLITAVQKGLQAGLTITQAVNKAVGKVKSEKDFDEDGARGFLDEKLKDYRVTLDPEKAIKEELKAQNDKIDNVIKSHYSVVERKKRSLVDKLVKDANIAEDQAEAISKTLSDEFDRLTKTAKEKALKKYLPKAASIKQKAKRQSLVEQIITDSNLGALSDEQYKEAINDKIGVESLTTEQAEKLTGLADKVQKSKEGFDKTNATERLLNYIANIKGLSIVDVGMSIWYANILSGISTQVLNISANFAETIGEVYTAAVLNPKQTGWILKGLFNGWGRGLLESMDTIKSGYQPTKFQAKISEASVLERVKFKGGKWNPYNYLKYVSRVMNAADIFFYHGINEMRARELAVSLARKESVTKQPTKEIIKKATAILYKGENPYQEALDQAKEEGFSGQDLKRRAYEVLEQNRPEFVIKDSNDEASKGTFNYDPEGTLGAMTAGVNQMIEKVDVAGVKPLKFVIPFTRIIANVTNRYLDWTPIGLLRAAKGGIGFGSLGENYHKKYTDQQRAEVLIRALTGITAMVAMYALTDEDDGEFQITANGTGDVQKNFELQETGWRPYSIKINDTWYEYKNTPLAIPFATIGFLRDAEKYQGQKDVEAKTSIILFGTIKYVMDLSFLQSLSSFMDTFSKENRGGAENFFKKATKSTEATVKSFILPNAFTQISRSMQEVMELPIKKANGVGDQIIRDMPILRDHLGNIYDALGDPVLPSQLERFIPLKPSKTDSETNGIWELIAKNKAWIGRPMKSTQKLNGDTLTDEEYDKYSLLAGKLTKKALKLDYRYLSKIKSQEEAKDEIDKIKSDARREAREILFGF